MGSEQSVASVLRELRAKRGESLRSAARGIGVDPSHLARIESGEKEPSEELRERLGRYYGAYSDEIAIASGHLPPDVVQILLAHPEEIARIRERLGSKGT